MFLPDQVIFVYFLIASYQLLPSRAASRPPSSYFEGVDHKYILLQGRRLINIKRPSGRANLFWAVFACGRNCFQLKQNETFNIGEVKIQEHWKKTCRRLLEYLVDQTDEDQLQDGTPIINLILLSGKKYEL